MILDSLDVDVAELERRTGWALKAEGACKGDVCVPLPDGTVSGGRADVAALAERLGMPLVADEGAGLWALGPESAVTGRVLTTAQAPELELPDLSDPAGPAEGVPFRLSSLRGQKVLLLAWASW